MTNPFIYMNKFDKAQREYERGGYSPRAVSKHFKRDSNPQYRSSRLSQEEINILDAFEQRNARLRRR